MMINSEATKNYINSRFQQQLKILEIEKTQSESISKLNNESLKDHLTVKSDFVYPYSTYQLIELDREL